MSINYTGSIIFQHDYSFILNQFVRFALKDKMTHTALVRESVFSGGETSILNAMPRGIIHDRLKSIAHFNAEIEVWTPLPDAFSDLKISYALEKTEEEVLGKAYGYLQILGYVPYYLLKNSFPGIRNPFTDGVWCSEYCDIYLNRLGWDPVMLSDKDATRPQEVYEAVIKDGRFKKTIEKKHKSMEFVFFN